MTSLKQMLKEPRPLVGLMVMNVTQPWLARIYKRSGADFAFVEYEHHFFNEADLASFVQACRAVDLPVVAKFPECHRGYITKLLDCGVTGIQLPWTESKEQIDRLVAYAKFPPIGIRSVFPGIANSDYDLQINAGEFITRANEETVIIAHVETRLGVEHIDEILDNPHVDVVLIGTSDLCVSYGQPGNGQHPDVVAGINRILAAARKFGKVVGMYAQGYQHARPWIEKGVKFFESAGEVMMVDAAARKLMAEFRAGGK